MKILLAVDGAVHAHDVVKYLVEHLDWYREKPTVELVFVHLPLPPLLDNALSADQIRRYYEDEGGAALAYSKNLALGSEAEKVIRSSPSPVLVVRPKAAPERQRRG